MALNLQITGPALVCTRLTNDKSVGILMAGVTGSQKDVGQLADHKVYSEISIF